MPGLTLRAFDCEGNEGGNVGGRLGALAKGLSEVLASVVGGLTEFGNEFENEFESTRGGGSANLRVWPRSSWGTPPTGGNEVKVGTLSGSDPPE